MNSNLSKTTPLGDLTEIRSGGTPSKQKAEYWGGNIPWVSAKDMKTAFLADAEDHITQLGSQNGTKVAAAGDLLVLVRGMTLHNDVPICVLSRPMAFNQDVKSLSPVGIDRAFLFYALMAKKPELLRRVESAGHGTGRLGAEQLKSLPIPRFDPTEEMEIAAILRALDDKIELNRRTAATLEEMARALYRSWFVDFDPVWAKTEGRTPAHMDEATAALFPDSFGDDGLPVGWRTGYVEDLFTLQRGFDLPASTRKHGPFPVLAAGGFHGRHSEFKVKGPGITTGRSGVIGEVFLTLEDFWPLNTSLWVKEFKRGSVYFTYFFLKFLDLKGLNSGSAVPSLNRNNVHNLITTVPTSKIISAFDQRVEATFAKVAQIERENQTLTALRDTLLPKLMTGELRVGKAQELVEVVA